MPRSLNALWQLGLQTFIDVFVNVHAFAHFDYVIAGISCFLKSSL